MPYALKLVQDKKFDLPLDTGIERAVLFLINNGIETWESCEGGEGHSYPEPAVRFHGGYSELLRAASLLIGRQFPVKRFSRVHRVIEGELDRMTNEVVFYKKVPLEKYDTLEKRV